MRCGLQPHRLEMLKLPKDPLLIEKVRDIVGLYLDPSDRTLVSVSMKGLDSSTRSQCADSADCNPACRSGARMIYCRHDTTSLVAALDVATTIVHCLS